MCWSIYLTIYRFRSIRRSNQTGVVYYLSKYERPCIMNKYYVCSKYGCVWMGKVEEMREDYSYGPDCWLFSSIEEAEAKIMQLQDENLVVC